MGHTIPSDFSGKSNFSVTFRLPGRGSQISRPILSDNGAGSRAKNREIKMVGLLQ